MARLSFRDRFFSPPVARAITSPSAILALGAGAAIGILATAFTGGIAAPIAAGILGGAVGYGGRVALAIPRNSASANVDPFGVDEPWRRAVQDAIRARGRFTQAVARFQHGPLREALQATADQLDEAVDACWQVAQQGQLLSDARKDIDDREVRWELEQAAAQIPPGTAASPVQSQTIASLQGQLQAAQRMDDQIRSTYEQLQLLNAQLDEAVTEAIELSVTNRAGALDETRSDLGDVVDHMTALRTAMGTLDGPSSLPAPPLPDPSPQVLDVTGQGSPEPPAEPLPSATDP